MTTTHDDNATTWRDLADQLTPQQIAEMEYCERAGIPPGLTSPQHQLNCARALSAHNIIQALCADIPTPPDAAGTVHDWEVWGGGRHGRMYTASTRTNGKMTAEIVGVQFDDHRIERFILAEANDDSVDDGQMTAPQARQFAALLIDAADELERLQK